MESTIAGLPHPDFGEADAAVLSRRPSAAASDEAAVIAVRRAGFGGFKVPKRVFFRDELPCDALGKVRKNLLRDRYGTTFKEWRMAGERKAGRLSAFQGPVSAAGRREGARRAESDQ